MCLREWKLQKVDAVIREPTYRVEVPSICTLTPYVYCGCGGSDAHLFFYIKSSTVARYEESGSLTRDFNNTDSSLTPRVLLKTQTVKHWGLELPLTPGWAAHMLMHTAFKTTQMQKLVANKYRAAGSFHRPVFYTVPASHAVDGQRTHL